MFYFIWEFQNETETRTKSSPASRFSFIISHSSAVKFKTGIRCRSIFCFFWNTTRTVFKKKIVVLVLPRRKCRPLSSNRWTIWSRRLIFSENLLRSLQLRFPTPTKHISNWSQLAAFSPCTNCVLGKLSVVFVGKILKRETIFYLDFLHCNSPDFQTDVAKWNFSNWRIAICWSGREIVSLTKYLFWQLYSTTH